MKKCQECKFYVGPVNHDGECHRYPPIVVAEMVQREYTNQIEAMTHYPQVWFNNEPCGEFAPTANNEDKGGEK